MLFFRTTQVYLISFVPFPLFLVGPMSAIHLNYYLLQFTSDWMILFPTLLCSLLLNLHFPCTFLVGWISKIGPNSIWSFQFTKTKLYKPSWSFLDWVSDIKTEMEHFACLERNASKEHHSIWKTYLHISTNVCLVVIFIAFSASFWNGKGNKFEEESNE
jgi:hypothetical protein